MKIINIKSLLIFAVLVGSLFSCNSDDETLENVRLTKSIVTLNTVAATATEGGTITFTLNVDTPNSSPMDYKIELYDSESTASFRDFNCSGTETTTSDGGFPQGKIGYVFQVPAFATSSTFTISPKKDLLKEGTETLKLLLRSSGNGLVKINPNSEIITITIADYVSNDVGVGLSWDKQTDWFGTVTPRSYLGTDNMMHDTDFFDYDLYIVDAGGTPVNFDGATGSNPELTVLLASKPNGVYDVYFEFFTFAGFVRPKVAFDHDMKLTISKYGVWSTTLQIPLNTDNSFAGTVAQITKTGNSYVVTDYTSGAVLASGKMATIKSKFLKNKI